VCKPNNPETLKASIITKNKKDFLKISVQDFLQENFSYDILGNGDMAPRILVTG
jgi:hypothetical protein